MPSTIYEVWIPLAFSPTPFRRVAEAGCGLAGQRAEGQHRLVVIIISRGTKLRVLSLPLGYFGGGA